MGTTRKYWKGLDELNQTPEFVENAQSEFPAEVSVDEFLSDDKLGESSTGRRDFLKFLGFSVAAATLAACEAPVIKAVPYVVKPEDVTPGMANWYASTYYDGASYASVLVKTREGRPIHIKGNRDFGVTGGGVNPQIIGSVLSLYDGDRLTGPKVNGEGESWKKIDGQIQKKLQKVADSGKQIVLLSSTVISPSLGGLIAEFKAKYNGDSMDEAPVDEADVAVAAAPVEGEEAAEPQMEQMPVVEDGIVRHIQYDAVSYNGMREANLESFGQRIIPDYDFSKAKTIVSIGADFLNSWVFPTQFTGQYAATRNPDADWMSKHFQFETNMSITGSNADYRAMVKPSEHGKVAALLHKEVTGKAIDGVDTNSLGDDVKERVKLAAESLKENKGASVVVAGANRKSIQVIVNSINNHLKNYGSVINLNNPLAFYQSEDAKLEQLWKDIDGKKVGAVIMWDTNPAYTTPDNIKFADRLGSVDLTISMSRYMDETASLCTYVCPDSHALESWNDYSPKMSHFALAQPTIRPMHNTRPVGESLMIWAGNATHKGSNSTLYYKYIRKMWKKYGFPLQTDFADFHSYSRAMVDNSCGNVPVDGPSQMAFSGKLKAAGKAEGAISGGGLEVSVYQKAGLGTGLQAGNPWLQEMPDPVSKVTWDNYITMNPADMEAGGYATELGQESPSTMATITVGDASFDLPVYPQPGQTPGTVGVALGYGRGAGDEKIGKGAYHTEFGEGSYGEFIKKDGKRVPVGQNAFKLSWAGADCFDGSVSKKDEEYNLACTQTHFTVMARNSIVKETTLGIYKSKDKSAYNHEHVLHSGWNHDENHISEYDLWDSHPVEHVGHRWGMTIDLSSCIGCGSCLIACQSENNVPVVGKDEVRRSREMHWLRLDRYYASDSEVAPGTRDPEKFAEGGFQALEKTADNPKVVYMPMMCHHCNHAPCETVCPVAATTHSNEGLNQMAYNRCIGTRYCANNCPYKVRRFNWFNYPSYRKFTEVNPAQDDLGRMVLNPDVVVRTRGVMEKCSFCVQRVQSGKLVAKKADRPVIDGDVVAACADSCPTNAITFGDWNDENSAVRVSSSDNRAYQALEEVGVKPNVWYKVKVRNEENEALAALQTESHHGGHGEEEEGHGHGEEAHEEEAAH